MPATKPAQSFVAAAKDFFGPRFPGQTALDFMKEVKALSEDDKAEIKDGLTKLGYNITT